jgi:Tfp pilus assembly protein PilF
MIVSKINANINGNYALFLEVIRKNYDQAEAYYKKSLELEPDNANTNGPLKRVHNCH